MSSNATSAYSRADLNATSSAIEQLRAANRERALARDGGLWTRERLGEHLWSMQVQALDSIRDHRFTAVQACHGPGKSRMASRAAAWWMETHPPGSARVVTTAPTGDQVKAILWSEINDAAATADSRGKPFRGRINETEWKIGKQLLAFGRKPSDYNPHAFQGIHARYVLVIIDEACGVVKQFWTAARALTTGEHCRILAIGNPDDPNSEFARVCASDRWNVIKISAFDTPNFTDEWVPDELREVLVGPSYVEDMRREFGEESPIYAAKVLGEFPLDSEDGVVRYSSLKACSAPEPIPRTDAEQLPVELGVDLGAGGDETVIQERRGMVVGRTWTTRTKDAMAAVGLILRVREETGATSIKLDVIGIGWGVYGRLIELKGQGKLRLLGDRRERVGDERPPRKVRPAPVTDLVGGRPETHRGPRHRLLRPRRANPGQAVRAAVLPEVHIGLLRPDRRRTQGRDQEAARPLPRPGGRAAARLLPAPRRSR